MHLAEMTTISGQKAIATYAKKDVSNFQTDERGWPIGAKVTLRGDMMYEFLDRLVVSVALPRTRDFRGINPKGFRWTRKLQPRNQGADYIS